ncbi:hypothetical protein IZY60_04240 [Lutibacter sp. B2]|nr:hypothetical protein [Lutibacter sp. B2]
MNQCIPFEHKIKEIPINKLKKYYKPKIFIGFCKDCKYYNKIWACPPYDFETVDLIDPYKYAYIIGSKIYLNKLNGKLKELLNNDHVEFVVNEIYKSARAVLDQELMNIENKESDSKVLFAGRCMMCDICAKGNNKPCIYPDQLRYSLESIGFDVSLISEEILEYKMLWSSGKLPEYMILVSAIFSNKAIDDSYYSTFIDQW